MMKPKIDDVIEYVKAGEDDRQMEKMLDLHPDGQEFLKQARFICKMLQDQAESADDRGLAASFDIAASSAKSADMRSVESMLVRDELTFYQEAPLRRRPKRSPSIGNMIDGEGQRSEDLGTLEIATEGKQVDLSYAPSTAVMDRYGKPYLLKYHAAQKDIEGIQIRGSEFTISIQDSLPSGEPMTLRMTSRTQQMPARNLGLIYMPDSGPFVRFRTDDEGIVELPVPDQPGTLRIESGIPQLLHITLKK